MGDLASANKKVKVVEEHEPEGDRFHDYTRSLNTI